MAVLAKNRSISAFNFYMNAIKLRKSLFAFCLRDFGIKSKVRSPVFFFDNTWSTEDKETIYTLFYNHDETKVEGVYPYWAIEMYRNKLMYFANAIIENIVSSYSIYPYTIEEAYLKRNQQDLAIAACYNLKATLEMMVDTLPMINKNVMLEFASMLDEEINMLKGWRKYNNKTLAKMQKTFSAYAKLSYMRMSEVPKLPRANPMVDKAKYEHSVRQADVLMLKEAEKQLKVDLNE